MEDIRFRAQDIASNKWLYGDLRHHKNDVCIFKQGGGNGQQVKPETVGQYTGCNDKNGNSIYKGDIVECVSWPFRRRMYIDFRKGAFVMVEPMPEPLS